MLKNKACPECKEFYIHAQNCTLVERVYTRYKSEIDLLGDYDLKANEEVRYKFAVELVQLTDTVSISKIQLCLRIGYNGSARLITRMEDNCIVSKPDNSGKRQVINPCFLSKDDSESNMKADLNQLACDTLILLRLKIGRHDYDIKESDRFMDNGYCVQLITQSKEISVSGFNPNPVLSKKAIKELLKFNRIGKSIFNISKKKLAKIEPAAVEILKPEVKKIKNGFYIWHPKDMGPSACHALLLNQVVQVIEGELWLTGCNGGYSAEMALKFGVLGKCVLTQD